MVSFIYANRDRDVVRIKASLDSLLPQADEDFEIVFVDYGSKPGLVKAYRELFRSYKFVRFFPLDVSHLLWNKSKALNYGIKKAVLSYIFIADVDLIFPPERIIFLRKIAAREHFFLFPLGYLDQKESRKLEEKYNFSDLKATRFGSVNGMILAAKEAFLEVSGLDEFFHFYGAEDEDLFARLENAGYKKQFVEGVYFYHNWHPSFSGAEDGLSTGNPRVKNIMRINQRHLLRNLERKVTTPVGQKGMAHLVQEKKAEALEKPSKFFRVANILAHVEHFLREELSFYSGETVEVEFFEDQYFQSLKYWLKKKMGRQSQPYITMKEVNDMLLKEILFKYRDYNYSFRVNKDLKSITFCIQL